MGAEVKFPYVICTEEVQMAVTIHWTGLLDWNTGLDYWTGIFSFFRQVIYMVS